MLPDFYSNEVTEFHLPWHSGNFQQNIISCIFSFWFIKCLLWDFELWTAMSSIGVPNDVPKKFVLNKVDNNV